MKRRRKDLEAELEAARKALANHVQRENARREYIEAGFRGVLTELQSSAVDAKVVICITQQARMFRAVVTDIEVDYGMVDVTSAPEFGGPGWREFVPGRRTVKMTIYPEPME